MSTDVDFILEIGVNHENSFETAIRLIDCAAKSGAKTVKFQTYTAEKLAARNSPSYWDLNEEPTESQIELFKKYDSFSLQQYITIYEYCEARNLEFMTTCFDEDWVENLNPYLRRFKIASADLTNYQLIRKISMCHKPVLLSTGAASMDEIQNSVETIRGFTDAPITLLHCVLNYPTSHENANLNRIIELRNKFSNLKIGYSDHTKPSDSSEALMIAYILGVRTFEKHFTNDKTLKGNDHYHAFDEEDVKKMLAKFSKIDKFTHYTEEKFLECQMPARKYARRGLYATRGIERGEQISSKDVISLRPIVDDGYAADEIDKLIGSFATHNIEKETPFKKSD